jgi:hypothetical protein
MVLGVFLFLLLALLADSWLGVEVDWQVRFLPGVGGNRLFAKRVE